MVCIYTKYTRIHRPSDYNNEFGSEKQSRMEEAMRKIKEDGENFDKVAREFSEDKAKQGSSFFPLFYAVNGHRELIKDTGGLLGEMTKDQLVKEFVDVAWGLEPSTVDKPNIGTVKTAHGYHLIMVEK